MTDTGNAPFVLLEQQPDFIVLNKAPGVSFHDEQALGQGLFNQVKQQLALPELYPVHRLDKMTSGLLLMATNADSARAFQQLFAAHQLEKYYLALGDGKPKKKQGLIKGDMAKSRRGAWKLLHSQQNPAITQFFSYSVAPKLRLFVLKPHSGKTHQIRVAMSSLGTSIIGDPLYNKDDTATRGYLHAFALKFELHGKLYQYLCPPDRGELFCRADMQQAIADITPPWQLPWPAL